MINNVWLIIGNVYPYYIIVGVLYLIGSLIHAYIVDGLRGVVFSTSPLKSLIFITLCSIVGWPVIMVYDVRDWYKHG